MAYTTEDVGFLASTMAGIRLKLNEGASTSKWTDSKLYALVKEAWAQIMDDVNGVGENPIIIRWNPTLVKDTATYALPGNFGKFVRWGIDPDTTGLLFETMVPRSRLNPGGGRLLFEGNRIRVVPTPTETPTQTIIVEYVPDGYCPLHTGTMNLNGANTTSTVLPLDMTPSEGYFDRRPGAYIGSVIRILTSDELNAEGEGPTGYTYFPVQERVIVSLDELTNLATVSPALDFNPTLNGLGQCTYEVVPFLGQSFGSVIEWRVASQVSTIEDASERTTRPKRFLAEYMRGISKIRLRMAALNTRTGSLFKGDVPGNSRFGDNVGGGSVGYY